jgi:hypothetical protein
MDAGFPVRERCSLAALSYRKTKDGNSTMLSFEPQSPPMSNEVYGRCENCRLINACQHDTVEEIDVGTSESAATRPRTISARPRLDCTTPLSSGVLDLVPRQPVRLVLQRTVPQPFHGSERGEVQTRAAISCQCMASGANIDEDNPFDASLAAIFVLQRVCPWASAQHHCCAAAQCMCVVLTFLAVLPPQACQSRPQQLL